MFEISAGWNPLLFHLGPAWMVVMGSFLFFAGFWNSDDKEEVR